MSDSIMPKIDPNEVLMLQAIQQEQERRRKKDKYRDPDRYPREELRRAIHETLAMHLHAYLEAEARRGNETANEVLMREPYPSPFTFGDGSEASRRPDPRDPGSEKLLERTSYSAYRNPVFRTFVDSATHSVVEEVLAFLDARGAPKP